MTALQKLEANERKQIIIDKRGCRCEVCGKEYVKLELAHRIPATKHNLKTYGMEIIHNSLNLVLTCPGNCNDSVLMNFASQPVRAKKLIEQIRENLKTGVTF